MYARIFTTNDSDLSHRPWTPMRGAIESETQALGKSIRFDMQLQYGFLSGCVEPTQSVRIHPKGARALI